MAAREKTCTWGLRDEPLWVIEKTRQPSNLPGLFPFHQKNQHRGCWFITNPKKGTGGIGKEGRNVPSWSPDTEVGKKIRQEKKTRKGGGKEKKEEDFLGTGVSGSGRGTSIFPWRKKGDGGKKHFLDRAARGRGVWARKGFIYKKKKEGTKGVCQNSKELECPTNRAVRERKCVCLGKKGGGEEGEGRSVSGANASKVYRTKNIF